MARVLIVGCGCRGRELAAGLRADGHAVRGTTRTPGNTRALEAAGVEPWIGDPDRIGTLTGALDGVTIVCWLLGSASGGGEALAALHGPRLRAFCERLVDTTVRGLVYEDAGTVPADVLERGAEIAREAQRTWEIPLRVVGGQAADVRAAIDALLAAPRGSGAPLDSRSDTPERR